MDRIHVMQLVRSFQVGEISRRTFLSRATAALGSAATANWLLAGCSSSPATNPPPVLEPAAASTTPPEPTVVQSISAGAAGLVTGAVVTYGQSGDQAFSGYLALPEASGLLPGVILIQEWWGLDGHIKAVANRLAGEGFAVLAPDLYHGAVATEPDEARKLVMALDQAAALQEILQAGDFLLNLKDQVRGPAVGITGFCMGGGLALQAAASGDPRVGAVAAWYGKPLDAAGAAAVTCPVLGFYGGLDTGIPVADVTAMEDALKAAGATVEVHVYPEAGHAFFNDSRAGGYNEAAAKDAWPRLVAWFGEHLG
ncbi:MAG: dienelactone hydrolase family protein [Ardenticatenia bacterium]|nr:dienelactone hydrolase family protein [Ardenticatenia bacterium]